MNSELFQSVTQILIQKNTASQTTAFDWAVNEIRSPAALLDGSTLRLYIAGHELNGIAPEHFAVGMMIRSLNSE